MNQELIMVPYEGPLAVVVPAAGVGKRMQANVPKQYLRIGEQTVLEHTVERLLSFKRITKIVVAISADDEYIHDTWLPQHKHVEVVHGGKERVDSVLAGIKSLSAEQFPWVLVHDAARPCVTTEDLCALIDTCLEKNEGGLLAYQVRDTMKQAKDDVVELTIERSHLWHALTPQMYPTIQLETAIERALSQSAVITDESSAIEYCQLPSHLINGSSENIKITRPADLTYAEFILSKQQLNRETV
ncbi:2-C-methyl-D-erythritol 4-phosphate cytidylyltransferase [Thalassotalea fusca]